MTRDDAARDGHQRRQAGSGPALIAGTHGMEHADPGASADARQHRSEGLTGAVIMVHVANMPSYLGRTIYYSPADNKNLNRVFPGKADGTLSGGSLTSSRAR